MSKLLDSAVVLAAGIVFAIYRAADAATDLVHLLVWLNTGKFDWKDDGNE
jgi:hypothetical protein